MILLGVGDEAGANLDAQIKATTTLGWEHIEMRGVEVSGFPKANFHDLEDRAFDIAAEKLQAAGLSVYCFGSTIMNWSKTVQTPFEVTLAEVRRAIPRMQRLGTRFVRIMSFKPGDQEESIPSEVFERVGEVTRMFRDAGLQPVHENCMNYGGMSWRHAEELLEKVPGLEWVFDTANPIFNADRSKSKPWPKQDPWEFWTHVRDRTAHIHIKDAIWNAAKNDADYTYPGEGHGQVRKILTDALGRGYDAGISIEPHVAVVFHDSKVKASEEDTFDSFVKYGRQLGQMVAEIKSKIPAAVPAN